MSSPTINAVALDVVGQYGLIGKNLVAAYRLGTQRVVSQINDRYNSIVKSSSLPLVDSSIRTSVVAANQQFVSMIVGGVTRATEQADLAIDRITEGTQQGIKRLGEVGQRLEAVVGAPVVDTLTKLNMPAAQVSLQIAGRLAEGSKRLAERVAGVEAAVVAEAAEQSEAKPRAKRASK
jgi:hypothetical protein